MKKIILSAACIAVSFCAHAQGAKPDAPAKLSVSQVINAGAALKQLTTFKFGGETLLKMAEMLDQSDKVQKTYTDAFTALIKQTYGSMEKYSTLQLTLQDEARKVDAGKMAPSDRTIDAKRDVFQAEADKMFSSPAAFSVAKIKRADLCLDAAPPACPQANAIPVEVIRALLPVLDK